jgi:hypothetical protein
MAFPYKVCVANMISRGSWHVPRQAGGGGGGGGFSKLPEQLQQFGKANQLDIHIILAKQEKLISNSLANQLGKNRNLAKLTSPRAYMRARIVVAIVVSL